MFFISNVYKQYENTNAEDLGILSLSDLIRQSNEF